MGETFCVVRARRGYAKSKLTWPVRARAHTRGEVTGGTCARARVNAACSSCVRASNARAPARIQQQRRQIRMTKQFIYDNIVWLHL